MFINSKIYCQDPGDLHAVEYCYELMLAEKYQLVLSTPTPLHLDPTMCPVAEPDGSEDVNDFLQRIRELGDKRDKEDEERTKKLEEEILQGRKERQARRAGQCTL